MTVLGKILVFVNLVFSLLVGFLVVMIYMTRTNYAYELDKERKLLVATAGQAEAYKKEAEREAKAADVFRAAKQAELQKVQQDLQTQMTINDTLKTKLTDEQKKYQTKDAIATAAQVEVQRRQADVAKMKDTLKAEMDKNIQLVEEMNKEREKAAQATIVANALKDTNKRLENQLQEKTRDLVRMRANLGANLVTTAPGGKNPPPEDVEGLIVTTDSASGLVKISLGSDAGLKRGHTMELFRLSQVPSQSKYLGTLKIIEVTATEAVAQPVSRLNDKPQRGDVVASRIIGS